ncbi:DNA polymerase III subunit gamma/tau [Erysipelothrix sp. HDW6A]|uniref:DNA polymerase III subunit gamma/tau n=1 Tax=Erysipelothrix sp. HDW6A TaxID=2714928 RepID=UPI0014088799|nr:DNA polymerase III subunit gamma/tau [Erysipelothrix sp. HDW6A]QIK56603.1 DNA polymerase III subunit gamma/tau [Erysipelothrix sp. HDW6A]
MSYQSLYRKYRPVKIDDVVAQEHIMNVLVNSIKKDKISHAYLFCGPRGTGKTSIAKLFARAINCTSSDTIACGHCENCLAANDNTHPDLVEIDAASNNGVDEIRGLIERVKYTPILGKYKVYIIDEVHMLSQGAFNALLKTLEEPPSHVVFILATTEIHKVIPTIISRCQRFDFTRIPNKAISKRLDDILDNEEVKAEPGVTDLIASLSGGGLRNALTILEQAIVLADDAITINQINSTNGIISQTVKIELFENIITQNMEALLEMIKIMESQSVQYERLLMDFITDIKDSVILSHTSNKNLVNINNLKFIEYLDESIKLEDRMHMIEVLLKYVEKMRFTQQPETYFEISVLELFSLVDKPALASNTQEVVKVSQKVEKPVIEEKLDEIDLTESYEEPQSNQMFEQFVEVQENEKEETVTEVKTTNNQAETQESLDLDLQESQRTELDEETLLRLMVTGNKDIRIDDERSFERINQYRNNPSWARPARLLAGGKVVISNDYFVVVAMGTSIEAKELGETRNQVELLKFSQEIFGIDKAILAITMDEFSKTVESFRERLQSQTLPNQISKQEINDLLPGDQEEVEDASLRAIKSLFGDEVEILD